jgi:hypothetical protein
LPPLSPHLLENTAHLLSPLLRRARFVAAEADVLVLFGDQSHDLRYVSVDFIEASTAVWCM